MLRSCTDFIVHLCFVIIEPRISGTIVAKVIRRIGLKESYVVEANGFSEGIWLLFYDSKWAVLILSSSEFYIHARLTLLGTSMSCVTNFVYGSPQQHRCPVLWDQLWHIHTDTTEAWLVAGDFNAYTSTEEKPGGVNFNWASL